MAGKLSPRAQTRLATLAELDRRVQTAHGLVEQFAVARSNLESLEIPLRRNFSQLKMHFMGAGLDSMSQLAGSMEITIRRGLQQAAKTRILREAIGSMRFTLELEQRSVVSAEREREAAEGGSAQS
ncbi:MAG: hypothetical protein ACYC28_02825 [Longimicrobiales bacterium]